MSNLSDIGAESNTGDFFLNTETVEPADIKGLQPCVFEPEYERAEVKHFSSTSTAATSNRPTQRTENTNW